MTQLIRAAQTGNLNQLKALVQSGADIEDSDFLGMTALMGAAHNGHVEVAQYLVGAGADIAAANQYGKTALMCAAQEGHVEVAQYLAGAGADITARNNNGSTALMWAALNGHLEVAQYLAGAGADITARNNDGTTALMLVALNGHLEVAQYLVGAGADITARNNDGDTALTWAAHNGHLEVARFLVGAGADLEASDNDGKTALMWAAMKGHVEVAQYLVGAGADLEASDNDGKTALMWAAMKGHVEVAQYLVGAGADIAAAKDDGITALICALTNNKLNIVKLFMYSGKVLSNANNELSDNLLLEKLCGMLNRGDNSAIFLDKIRNMLLLLNTVAAGGLYGLLTRVRLKLSSWRERISGEDEAIFSSRVNLLAARVCGVAFPEGFTEWYSGMPISKFKAVSSLMRAAKLAKLAHNFNAYSFMYIFMLKRSASTMLAKIPFHSQARTNLLSFIVGVNSVVIMQELTEARKSSEVTSLAEQSMQEAVINNNIAEIAALLDNGVDVNAKLSDNKTALMFAAMNGHVELSEYLKSAEKSKIQAAASEPYGEVSAARNPAALFGAEAEVQMGAQEREAQMELMAEEIARLKENQREEASNPKSADEDAQHKQNSLASTV